MKSPAGAAAFGQSVELRRERMVCAPDRLRKRPLRLRAGRFLAGERFARDSGARRLRRPREARVRLRSRPPGSAARPHEARRAELSGVAALVQGRGLAEVRDLGATRRSGPGAPPPGVDENASHHAEGEETCDESNRDTAEVSPSPAGVATQVSPMADGLGQGGCFDDTARSRSGSPGRWVGMATECLWLRPCRRLCRDGGHSRYRPSRRSRQRRRCPGCCRARGRT